MYSKHLIYWITGLTLMAIGPIGLSHANDADGDESQSEIRLNAGLTLTDGNSDTMRANLGLQFEGERAQFGSVLASVEGNYGKSKVDGTKDTDMENIRGHVTARKTLTPRTFAYGASSALYDKIAEVDYRFIVGPGYGYYFIKNERASLSAEAGPSYLWERVSDAPDNHMVVRMAQRLDVQISETARFWQQVEYLPKAEDFRDYLLNAEIGIEAALNSRMNLRVVLQNAYDSEPGEDLKKNDMILISGLSIKL